MTPEHWETVRAVLILLGGLATGVITSKTVRKSQKESSQITLATDLINQVQEERNRLDGQLQTANEVIKELGSENHKRDLAWRNHTRKLRSQLHEAGVTPVEPPDELGV